MEGYIFDVGAAVWLGILTSISPCPLATNIAAISYISKQLTSTRAIIVSGLSYALGRTVAYVVLGALLVSASQAIPAVSMFLQRYMNLIIGPALIIIGLFVVGVFSFAANVSILPESIQKRLAGDGAFGSLLLGAAFALTFCPVSAALFFGSTISIAVKHGSRIVMPSLFGIGTALPVLVFAFVIALSAHKIGAMFNKVAAFEKWFREISGIIILGVGAYLTVRHTFHVF